MWLQRNSDSRNYNLRRHSKTIHREQVKNILAQCRWMMCSNFYNYILSMLFSKKVDSLAVTLLKTKCAGKYFGKLE